MEHINGLNYIIGKSTLQRLSFNGLNFDGNWIGKYLDNGYFTAYMDFDVIFGKIQNGKLIDKNNILDPMHVKVARFFNEEREIYVWKTKKEFIGRLRIDGEGEPSEYIEACQVIWGTKALPTVSGWTTITEDRGTKITLPLAAGKIDNKERRVLVKTRNYIGYNKLGQASYIDSRLLNFAIGGE